MSIEERLKPLKGTVFEQDMSAREKFANRLYDLIMDPRMCVA